MFALPFTASLPWSLSQHLPRRFVAQPAQASVSGAVAPVAAADVESGAEHEIPDLAQRVREVGEW